MQSERELALITGATSGIGKAFAERFAEDGYDLILTGRRRELLDTQCDELKRTYDVNVEVVIAELTNDGDVQKLVQRVRDATNLAILVNNAGFGTTGFFHEESEESQVGMVKCHVLAPVLLTHAAIPTMVKAGKGAIINVSSLRAFGPTTGTATYSSCKAYLNRFTESLSLELRGTGVRVQALCPGYTVTDFHSRLGLENSGMNRGMVRWMTANQVVEASLRCLAKDRIVCIPGFWNQMLAAILKVSPLSLLRRFAHGTGGNRAQHRKNSRDATHE